MEVTLTDEHLACLRAVRAMMELNDTPSQTDDEVLTRALALAAEAAEGKIIHEIGDELAETKLREMKAYPFRKADPLIAAPKS